MNMSGSFFYSGPFMPHGGCYLWTQSLIALHAGSDAAIVLAYYSIPFTLLYFVRKRKDLKFHWIFVCFAAFVLACGTTHLMEIWNIWHANYWLSGFIKAVTALVSVPTAFLLVKLVPQALALPGADDLRKARDELEIRVRERTAELEQTTQNLQTEIIERRQAEAELRWKTAFLEAQVDSTLDGILVVDAHGKKILQNRRLTELFKIPPPITEGKEDAAQIEFVTNQMKNPRQFMDKVAYLYAHPDEISRDEIELIDGTVLDRYSSPVAGRSEEYYGRIWAFRDITAHRQAETALRESEERYNALFNRSLDCVFLTDFGGKILDANQASLDLLGCRREHISASTFASLLTEDQLPLAFQTIEEIKALGHQKCPAEFRLRRKDGRQVYVEIQASLIYRDGKPFAIQGIARDLTQRKRAELTLANERALLRNLVDNLPLAVYLKDTAGRKTLANPVDLRNQGVTSETEIRGKTDSDIFPPAQAAAFEADDQQVLNGQPVFNREEKLTRPDGTVIWLLTSKVPLRDITGRVTGLVGLGLDITERKRADEVNVRLATAVEQAAETIVITDASGTILYANPAFEKSSGYTRAEVLGQNPRLLKSGRHHAEFYRQMWGVLGRGEIWHGHFINKRKDGTLYEEEATISPVKDPAGKIVNHVAVKRDVTNEVQLEAQFRQSQKMEAVGKLAGGVAHDFNNLLAVLQMQVSLLKSGGELSAEQSQYASDIGTTIERATALTRQLLLFSRREMPQPGELDLSASIASLTKMLRRILGEDIELEIKLPAQPMFVHADAGMMDQVMMNLVVNARDAMLNGGRLVIEAAGVEFDESAAAQSPPARPGSFVCLSAADTGSGIPPEILPRIFEPFYTTKDVGKGTGLGLATVFGIVQRHEGWINVTSEVGHGTTFRIYLPRLAGMAAPKIAEKMPAPNPTGNETILLVEDEAPLRVLVRKSLARQGYRVLEAPTGGKALAVWQEHRDDIRLLLTDLVMPDGMSGKELAQRLLRENPGLKVIYTSGYSTEVAGNDLP